MSIAKQIFHIANKLDKKSATEIPYEELSDDKKALIKKLKIEKKVEQVFDGIHGSIIVIKDFRFDKNDVKKLVADKNFRWLDATQQGNIAIGF